jgi:hypothetical protein
MTLLSAGITTGTTGIDGFEDQDLSEYRNTTVDMAGFSTTAFEGTYSHDPSAEAGPLSIYSLPGDGLANYPSKGTGFDIYIYPTAADAGRWAVLFGAADENNHYRAWTNNVGSSGGLFIQKVDGGSVTDLATDFSVSYTAGQWFRIRVVWDDGTLGGSDNDLTATLFDTTDGSQVAEISANDATFATNDGVGLYWNQKTAGETFLADRWEVV